MSDKFKLAIDKHVAEVIDSIASMPKQKQTDKRINNELSKYLSILPQPKMTLDFLWNRLINFINGQQDFSRIRLIKLFGHSGTPKTYNSIDCYKNLLRKAGFIKTLKPGIYRKVKDIPLTLTTKECTALAYKKI